MIQSGWLLTLFLVSVLLLIGYVFLTGRIAYPTTLAKSSQSSTSSTLLVTPPVLFETSLTSMQKKPATTPIQDDLNIDSLACLQQVSAGWVCFGMLGNDSDAQMRAPRITVTLNADAVEMTQIFTPLVPVIPPKSTIPFHTNFPAIPDLIANQIIASATWELSPILPRSIVGQQNLSYVTSPVDINSVQIDAYGRYTISYRLNSLEGADDIGVVIWLLDDDTTVVGYRIKHILPQEQADNHIMVVIPYIVSDNLSVHAMAWGQQSPQD